MTGVPEPSGPGLPTPMTLAALQAYVARMVEARGFTVDRDEVFILLTEEVGELATELLHGLSDPRGFNRGALALELADVLMYLLDVANGARVDLTARWPAPEEAVRAGWGLNWLLERVVAGRTATEGEDLPERLALLLSERLGRIATELRKSWKGLGEPERIADELIAALTTVLRIAHCFQLDLEAAVRDKEAQNARRVWSY